jgi:uncharacterized membrane protein
MRVRWIGRAAAAAMLATLFCGLVTNAPAARRKSPRAGDLATYEWLVKASPNLAKHPPSAKAVESFLRAVEIFHQRGVAPGRIRRGVLVRFRGSENRGCLPGEDLSELSKGSKWGPSSEFGLLRANSY